MPQSNWSKYVLFFFCVITIAIIASLPCKFSYVYNEQGRLASGLIHLQTGDYSTFHVNPPLPDMVGALPVFFTKTYCPTRSDLGFSQFGRLEYKAGDVWVNKNPHHFRWMVCGRYCMTIFILIGTIIIYLGTKSIFGDTAAVVASLFWIFSPYVLGNGCLVCPDVPSASMALAAVFIFHRWLKCPEVFESLLAGLVLGLAELTKFTLLIFYPLFLVLWLLYRKPTFKQLKQLVFIFAMSILVVNMGYLFEETGKPLGNFKFQTTLLTGYQQLKDVPSGGDNRFKNSILGKIPVPLPANFVQGIDTQRLDFERGLPSYLRGEHSRHGWWYYYLYALLLKTPLGTLAIFIFAIVCSCFRNFNASWKDEMVILLPGMTLLAFVSSQTGFSVHSRYVIPALPFFFIWMGKVGKCFTLRRKYLFVIVSVLLAWSIASSLWIYPHSLSYYNELATVIPTPLESRSPQEPAGTPDIVSLLNAGARNGGRHLLESNIDWGQDIFYLEKWCQRHSEVTKIYTALSGSYPLEQTQIPSCPMPPLDKLQPGWYAVSVNHLYGKDKTYSQFLEMKPVARIGFSIYVYRVNEPASRKPG